MSHRLGQKRWALLLLLAGLACAADDRGFLGLYVDELWLEGVEESKLPVSLLRQLDLDPAWWARDWYKIEVLPDRLLVDDGRLEIENLELVSGKLRFEQEGSLRGYLRPLAQEPDRVEVTVTDVRTGGQERRRFVRMRQADLDASIRRAEERARAAETP